MNVQSFRINVSQATLDDLRERLVRTRWPDEVEGAGWDYGTNRGYLKELVGYWQRDFDWRAAEKRLNQWPHFLTRIDGERLHFIHARSPHPAAMPLLLTHGWPGSVVEFLDGGDIDGVVALFEGATWRSRGDRRGVALARGDPGRLRAHHARRWYAEDPAPDEQRDHRSRRGCR